MKQISLCRFCGDGFENRGLALDRGDVSPLVILRYDDNEEDVRYATEQFPDATIAFRFACTGVVDYNKAMLGCAFFIRSLIRERKVIVIPKEYVSTFFNLKAEEVEVGVFKVNSGAWLVIYDRLNATAIAEYERVKKGV